MPNFKEPPERGASVQGLVLRVEHETFYPLAAFAAFPAGAEMKKRPRAEGEKGEEAVKKTGFQGEAVGDHVLAAMFAAAGAFNGSFGSEGSFIVGQAPAFGATPAEGQPAEGPGARGKKGKDAVEGVGGDFFAADDRAFLAVFTKTPGFEIRGGVRGFFIGDRGSALIAGPSGAKPCEGPAARCKKGQDLMRGGHGLEFPPDSRLLVAGGAAGDGCDVADPGESAHFAAHDVRTLRIDARPAFGAAPADPYEVKGP